MSDKQHLDIGTKLELEGPKMMCCMRRSISVECERNNMAAVRKFLFNFQFDSDK